MGKKYTFKHFDQRRKDYSRSTKILFYVGDSPTQIAPYSLCQGYSTLTLRGTETAGFLFYLIIKLDPPGVPRSKNQSLISEGNNENAVDLALRSRVEFESPLRALVNSSALYRVSFRMQNIMWIPTLLDWCPFIRLPLGRKYGRRC